MVNLLFTIIDSNQSHIFLNQTPVNKTLGKEDKSCQGCKKKCTNLSLFNLMKSETDFISQYAIPKNRTSITNYSNQTHLSLNLSIQNLLYLLIYLLFIPLLCFVGTVILMDYLVLNELLKHEIVVLITALIVSFFCWLFIKKTIQNKLYQSIKEVK